MVSLNSIQYYRGFPEIRDIPLLFIILRERKNLNHEKKRWCDHRKNIFLIHKPSEHNVIDSVRKTKNILVTTLTSIISSFRELVQAGISSNSRCSPLFIIVRAEILSVGRQAKTPSRRHDCFRPREGIEITGNWTDGCGKFYFWIFAILKEASKILSSRSE